MTRSKIKHRIFNLRCRPTLTHPPVDYEDGVQVEVKAKQAGVERPRSIGAHKEPNRVWKLGVNYLRRLDQEKGYRTR
jgi:hypothetical protein